MMPIERDLHAQVQELTVEVAVLKSRLELTHGATERALKIQANEYQRRLDELNNSHQRAERILATYLTVDKFEHASQSIAAETLSWRSRIEQTLAKNEGGRAMATAILAIIFSMISAVAVFSRWLWF